jgi:hypothetical protein
MRSDSIKPFFLIAVPIFQCSPRFVGDFRKSGVPWLRRPSPTRLPAIIDAQMNVFIQMVTELIRDNPREQTINIDKTNWRTVAPVFKIRTVTGAESVRCIVDIDDKQGVTGIAAVNATGEKLREIN